MAPAVRVACQAAWEVCPAVVQADSQALVGQAVPKVATTAQPSRRLTKLVTLTFSTTLDIQEAIAFDMHGSMAFYDFY